MDIDYVDHNVNKEKINTFRNFNQIHSLFCPHKYMFKGKHARDRGSNTMASHLLLRFYPLTNLIF